MQRVCFKVCRDGDESFLVKSESSQHLPCSSYDDIDALSRYMVPSYSRPRVFQVVEFQQRLCLVCSCSLFQKSRYPCRHIYSVLGRTPIPSDAIVRYHKVYRYCYGQEDVVLNQKFEAAMANEPPGPVFLGSDLPITPSDMIPSAFALTLPSKSPVLHSDSRWKATTQLESIVVSTQEVSQAAPSCSQRQTQEIGLSQAAAEDDDFPETDYDWDSYKENIAGTSNTAGKKRDNYRDMHSYFVQLVKLADADSEATTVMRKGILDTLESVRMLVAEKRAQTNTNTLTNGGIISSCLELERSQTSKRKRPFGSLPAKNRKKY